MKKLKDIILQLNKLKENKNQQNIHLYHRKPQKVRIEVISRSSELINLIETITKLKLSIKKTHQDKFKNALKFIENEILAS